MRRILISGLDAGRSLWKRRNHGCFMPPAVIPRTRIRDFSVELLPGLSLCPHVDKLIDRPGHNRNVDAAD